MISDDELLPYQQEAYTIANRVLLAASRSMAVGYRTDARNVQMGQGKRDFFFVQYAGQINWAWPGPHTDGEVWDSLILGRYSYDRPLSLY